MQKDNSIKEKQILKLTFPVPPSVNLYKGYRGIVKGKYAIVTTFVTKETEAWKENFKRYLIEETSKQNWKTDINKNCFYLVDIIIYFQRTNMDVNNHHKVPFDAITETQLIWSDDKFAVEQPRRVYYDSKNPRVEYVIYEADWIGIFENTNDYNDFINTYCSNCKRYKFNEDNKCKCSIHQNMINNKICEEVYRDENGKWKCKKCNDKGSD